MLGINGVGKPDDFQVAPGYADGKDDATLRVVILGAAKRCTFAQFLDYTWRATKTEIKSKTPGEPPKVYWDDKPDPATVKFVGVKAELLPGSNINTIQLQNVAVNAQGPDGKKLDRKVKKVDPDTGLEVSINQKGYTSNVDEPGKLWPKAVSWTPGT
jgi:hypothetical protein